MHLVEVDADAVSALREKLGGGGDGRDQHIRAGGHKHPSLSADNGRRYTIHNEDVMAFDFSKAGFPIHVVGNLPYNIGARVIKKTLMYAPQALSCTFMVQKEVAARIVSGPGGKQNGFLSIFCQFFGQAKLLFHVPPGAFFPRPNVDSSVFQIIVDQDVEKKLGRELWDDFFSFADCGFSMRRKQLAKTLSLKLGKDKEFYCDTLSRMGIDASARPEDLGVSDWLDLYKRVRR
jgi:16S rRNA (adenine1518-N6/adenine1519-N6)-dimethyltransferase